MRMVWATDIHLNFLAPDERAKFFASIVAQQADGVFVTGDIAEAPTLVALLDEMHQAVQIPVYFVLGNHDYYFSSVRHVRLSLTAWCENQTGVRYLPISGVVRLTPTTVLVGQDGWGDGRYGDYQRSPVRLTDQVLIEDFQGLDRAKTWLKLKALGDREAEEMGNVLREALAVSSQVICLTHVPPFKEACWYEGKIGNDDWLPFFTCKAVGDVLIDVAEQHPQHAISVYCGHTHHEGSVTIRPNLTVITGSAEYGAPRISEVLEIE